MTIRPARTLNYAFTNCKGYEMDPIDFVLWVFEDCGITDAKRQEIANFLSVHYLRLIVGGRIRNATARVVANTAVIAPNRFDAVVFLVNIGFKGSGSIMKRLGVAPEDAIAHDSVKGLTAAWINGGGVAEVYWNRCELIQSVCAAIFHEACHLKFNNRTGHLMHTQRGEPGFGGEGVRILASHATGRGSFPNAADIYVFRNTIPNAVPLRNRVPA